MDDFFPLETGTYPVDGTYPTDPTTEAPETTIVESTITEAPETVTVMVTEHSDYVEVDIPSFVNEDDEVEMEVTDTDTYQSVIVSQNDLIIDNVNNINSLFQNIFALLLVVIIGVFLYNLFGKGW